MPVILMLMLPGFKSAYAQVGTGTGTITARGIVVDDFGNPVEGVLVKVKGDSVATSDNNGSFDVTAEPTTAFTFEHPAFYRRELVFSKKQYIPAAEQDSTIIILAKDSAKREVNEYFTVKLTGAQIKNEEQINVLYGTKDKQKNIGSISTVNPEQLRSTLAPTILYGLQGRVPGLYISQIRGFRNPITQPNSTQDLGGNVPRNFAGAVSDNSEFSIGLRGQAPVIVVDGVQRDIYSIDPENIESVSVLKDALSSILLGMRSSRGVMVITTKRPNAEGFRLSFTGQVGAQMPLSLPKALPAYQYAYLLNEALQNDGKAPIYTNEDFQAYRNGTDPIGHPDVDWYNTIMRKNAPISSYNLNVSGGGKVARYSISGSYMDQQGLFRTSDVNSYQTNAELKRYLINSNVAIDVTKEFTIDLSLFGRIQDGVQPGIGTTRLLSEVLRTPNNAYPIYNPNGSYGGNVSYQSNLKALAINSGYMSDNSRDALANVTLKYNFDKFVKGLSLKAITNVSSQNITGLVRRKSNTVFQYQPGENGEGEKYTQYGETVSQSNDFLSISSSRFWYGQLSADYNRTFGRHTVGAKLLGDYRVVSINYDLPQKPANLAATLQYDFGKKYFVEAAVDRSYYNGYLKGRQWGTFYAFGAGWDIAKEGFLQDLAWINQIKLRGVYGKTGNGIDNAGYYIFRQTYSKNFTDFAYDQGFSRSLASGMIENAPLANPNITWEKAEKLDAGIDVSLFKNQLQFTADYYYDQYYDLLQPRGKSIALIGFTYPWENIGKRLYTGWELSLTYQNNIRNFNYFLTGNWSVVDSKIIFQDEQNTLYNYNRTTGLPVTYQFGYVADGLFGSQEEVANSAKLEGVPVMPGDIKYKDLNSDGAINQYDQTAIGGIKPLSFYGITGGFNFKGFDVSVFLQGVYNRDLYIRNGTIDGGFEATGQSYLQAYEQVLNRWTPETAETATYPRLTAGQNENNSQVSSFWVRSGNYIRLKNVSIGYTLPFKLSSRYNISQVRLFVNGQNLFTKAAYQYTDPEVTNFMSYPNLKVISAGVTIKL